MTDACLFNETAGKRRGLFSCNANTFLARVAQRVGIPVKLQEGLAFVPLWLVILLERKVGTDLWRMRYPRESSTGRAAALDGEFIRELRELNKDSIKRKATLVECIMIPTKNSYLKNAPQEALEMEDWDEHQVQGME